MLVLHLVTLVLLLVVTISLLLMMALSIATTYRTITMRTVLLSNMAMVMTVVVLAMGLAHTVIVGRAWFGHGVALVSYHVVAIVLARGVHLVIGLGHVRAIIVWPYEADEFWWLAIDWPE